MIVVNLLEFLNSIKTLNALDYAKCSANLVNFLDLLAEEEQFTRRIDIGVMYLQQVDSNKYTVVDGL